MVIDLQTDRRRFLAGLLATGFVPNPTWADVGSPLYLSAGALPDETYVLCGIDAAFNVTFQRPLPGRGHAAAAHPTRPEAVAFARRPGTFAVVIDCATGAQRAMLEAPVGRHFYGHGAFSSDGRWLFTTENDFEAGRGRIGVWDATASYVRVDEWDSGGIGPHDIKRLPGTETLVVANGGIDTHPDSGRTKLNIPTMRPNLSYIADGQVIDVAVLPTQMRKNSIRHLSVAQDGAVAFGMQWQGDGSPETLVGFHRLGAEVSLMRAPIDQVRDMDGYIGSIAFSRDGDTVAVTSPRGGTLQFYDVETASLTGSDQVEDVCGVSTTPDGFLVTAGTGALGAVAQGRVNIARQAPVRWDNHLVSVG